MQVYVYFSWANTYYKHLIVACVAKSITEADAICKEKGHNPLTLQCQWGDTWSQTEQGLNCIKKNDIYIVIPSLEKMCVAPINPKKLS